MKNNKFSNTTIRKGINVVAALIIIFNIISLILIFSGINSDSIYPEIQKLLFMSNSVLWIMAVGSCFIYYFIYKENDIFFFSQAYILVGLESVYIYFIHGNFKGYESSMSIVSLFILYVYRIVITYFTINNETPFAKILIIHKKITIGTTFGIIFIVAFVEYIINSLHIKIIDTKPILFISFVLIIHYFYLMFILAKKSFKKNQIIYILFVASINIFNVKRVFYTIYTFILDKEIYDFIGILTFFGFSVIIVGIFIEMYFRVTENNKINEKMKKSEDKLKNITENILDMICTIDSKGIVTYLNKASLDALECSAEEGIGKSYKKFMVDDHIVSSNLLDGDLSKGTLIKHLISYGGKKGIEVESLIRRLLNDKGEIEGYIVVSRNTQMGRELESLTIKYNEIKEYNKIRTEFFANLSHEVRTPINIISSCIQLLNKENEKGEDSLAACYNKYEKTLNQNCLRILRLINNLIDITKIESGYMKMNFTDNDIVLLVEDLTMSVVPYVEGKSIDIMFDTDMEEKVIRCDSEQIERAMLNLISNSVKFTNPGGKILVNINVDDEWINIRVEDTGIGIPMGMKEIIFERFMQTDKSLNRENEGSGIGLALVKSIVNSHEGNVTLEKSDKEGSVFLVKLPNRKLGIKDVESREIRGSEKMKIKQMIGIEFSDIYENK